MLIGIVDYGAGNLKNVCSALEYLNCNFILIQSSSDFLKVDTLIIPGVGAFSAAMKKLNDLYFVEPIKHFAHSGRKILGICLGMQLLFNKSYEFGETSGLGLLDGSIKKIPEIGVDGAEHKIPHMGWNELISTSINSDIYFEQDAMYFSHSFMAQIEKPFLHNDVLAYCDYNGIHIPALIRRNNIWGCQFHPEKSADNGLFLLKKILES